MHKNTLKMTLLAVAPVFLVGCIFQGNGAPTETVADKSVIAEITELPEPQQAAGPEQEEIEDIRSAAEVSDDTMSEEVENIVSILGQFPELEDYVPHVPDYGDGVFHVSGNFFGERDDDLAVLVRTKDTGRVRLLFINKGNRYGRMFVFFEENNPGGDDYYWVGEMRAVPAGEPLWSNYTDDFRAFEDVPEDEIVIMPYDAVYVHVAEACGGGFIYWDDGVFRWLQQE
ncbi:MAG: hypothetical protein LUD76_08790 [Alistipes sp.]|nr:hypothetical protein [Alistipes sp.]